MIRIVKAVFKDVLLIMDIGKASFYDSHHTSASKEVMDEYIDKNFIVAKIEEELMDPENIFYLIYYKDQAAGFSKICLNNPHPNINTDNITKLERIYLLSQFQGLKLGYKLFNFNVELSKNEHQKGIWLFVWTENTKALNFYTKTGFKIIDSHDFSLSKDHSNPNHQMLLTY